MFKFFSNSLAFSILNCVTINKKTAAIYKITAVKDSLSSASGDRTRVSAVRGRRPRPLDECTVACHSFHCLTMQS